ncbi:hypothetical protein NE237_007699 [Protea cynaroides]|uniref:SWIM-type domain-containing protein n=1 Tax=Protea cynaroides TaxID=273540 RepID=A0A9Q0KQ01_9MAGN|nr:hypothetical protein NE237_007699 [Protea cynaroides]
MSTVVSIVYSFQDRKHQKYVDPDKYGYLDIVYDIYSSVLRHLPARRTVRFSVKFVLSENHEELQIASDDDVLNMFCLYKQSVEEGDKPIHLAVNQVEVSDCCTTDYSVNGYPSAVIGRDESKGKEIDASMHPSTDVIGKQAGSSGGQKVRIKKTLVSKGNKRSASTDAREATFIRARTRAATRGDASTGTSMIDLTQGSGKGTASTNDTMVYSVSEDEELSFDDSSDEDWRQDKDERSMECGTTNSDSESDTEGNGNGDEDSDGGRDSNDGLSDYHSDDCYEVYNWNYDIDEEAKVNFHVGLCFNNVDEFRAALKEYNIQEGRNIRRLKNEKARVTAVCASEGCKWRIHALPTSDEVTFMVKSYYPDHTCSRLLKNSNATSTWIATKLASKLRTDPDMKTESIHAALNAKYGINPHKQQLYRARKIARQETEGSFKISYAQLPKYGELLREKNPGTVFKLQPHERIDFSQPPVFKRLFICLDACKKGFLRGCRPFIGLDVCHLRGTYEGVFLSAISIDGNNGLFPLAFAVVESETKDSWSFFLYNLYSTIDTAIDGLPLTFMSDKQKGLSDAIEEIFPDAFHRNCCQHLYSNFNAQFTGMQLGNDFWAACKASSAVQFQKAMSKIQIHNKEAHDWLLKNPVGKWARHAFDHRAKSDHITNDMTKSFSQWIDYLKGKPILTLIDSIRVKLMSRLHRRFEKGCSYKGKLTPRMKKKLELVKSDARFCMPIPAGGNEFEVAEANSRRFVVNLNNKTCDCGVWECSGIPCKHAASALIFKRQNLEDYCDKYYTMERYMQAYGEMIHPLPDLTNLEASGEGGVLQPPLLRRLPGRPHKNKKRELGEAEPGAFRRGARTVRCDICKETGHNRRTCQRTPVKEKRQSSRQRATKKGNQMNTRPTDSNISCRLHARSQSSTIVSSQISIPAKRRAQMAAKREKQKKRAKEALGQ